MTFIVKTVQAYPNFETLIGNFEDENETLNRNFETLVWNFIKFLDLPWNFLLTNFVIWFVNQLMTQNLENKPNFEI